MPADRFEIGVVVAKRRLQSRWADYAWLPVAVLPAAAEAAPWTRLSATENEDTFYAGSFEVSLHPSETSHYGDNLACGNPCLWVALRHIGGDDYQVASVTADPYQGEALAEGIGEIIEAVPMPREIQAKLAEFFQAFHQERPFIKRKRDRADPEALARRGAVRWPPKAEKP
jgi:hypothetical protein